MHVYLADIDAIMLSEAQAEIEALAAPNGGSATAVVTYRAPRKLRSGMPGPIFSPLMPIHRS